MVAISPPDNVFSRPKDPRDVIYRDSKLQEHGSACMPKNVRCYFGPEARQVACRTPRPPLLRCDWLARPFDHVSRRKPAPSAKVRHEARGYRERRPTL
jgi:hypothetical protein